MHKDTSYLMTRLNWTFLPYRDCTKVFVKYDCMPLLVKEPCSGRDAQEQGGGGGAYACTAWLSPNGKRMDGENVHQHRRSVHRSSSVRTQF